MAEGLMRKKLYELGKYEIDVASAGIRALPGMPPTDETIEVMNEEGVDISTVRSKNLTRDVIKSADLILVMEPFHKEAVLDMMPEAAPKTCLLKEYMNPSKILPNGFSIHDPIGQPVEEYRTCLGNINNEIERIAKLV